MINSVALTGRLTKDVDLRTAQNGISVARFTLAVNRQYSKDKEADFINCVAFKKTAEVLQQFAGKGRLIGVTGSIQTRHYTGKDGKEVYVTEVVVDNFSLLESRRERDQQPSVGALDSYQRPAAGTSQGASLAQKASDPFGAVAGDAAINVSSGDLPF